MVRETHNPGINTTSLPLSPSVVSNRWQRWVFIVRLIIFFTFLVFRNTGRFSKVVRVFKVLQKRHRTAYKSGMLGKIARVDGKIFWHLFSGGAPSEASGKGLSQEIFRILNPDIPGRPRTLMLAITKRCPLACEHCYEADLLNGTEIWSREDLVEIVRQYQEAGISMFWLGGGEPMARYSDLRYLLQKSSGASEFWIATSGYRMNDQAARDLKADGLNGVIISLDHFDPMLHNRFRGSPHAFQWAVRACVACKRAGLATVLSVCATRSFSTEANVRKYMELAKDLGVAFVLMIEPKAAGRYAGKEVALFPDQVQMLERLTMTYNNHPDYRTYPILEYPDMLGRLAGCGGAGNRHLYINSNGMVQVCPFCQTEVAKALAFSAEETIRLATRMSCPVTTGSALLPT